MTNLCCLSAYSFGESCVRIKDYVLKAKELGYTAVGLCDKNHLYGFPLFFECCKREGMRPIGGITLQFSKGPKERDGVLFILSEEGYGNLCDIIALKKETYSLEDLEGKTKGLALVFPMDHDFLDNDFFLSFSRTFEDFYLGLRIRSKDDEDHASEIRAFAQDHSYPLISFPRVEYLGRKGKFIVSILKANQDNRTLTEAELKQEREGGPDFLLSPKVKEKIYTADEIKNEDMIAQKATFSLFDRKRGGLFSFTGNEETDFELFLHKCEEGMRRMNLTGDTKYENRLEYETSIIKKMGFISYFLIVQDYVNHAKETGISVGPGRGSAAGSLVSYILGITSVDPLRFDLSFERFLNPKRVTMPDIDVDFEDDRRDEICDYLTKKYGESKTAKIITFGSYQARSALSAIGQVMGINDSRLKSLKSAIPSYGMKTLTLKEAWDNSSRLKDICLDPYYQRIFELAKAIEDLPNNTSIHAAGMIISDKDIYKEAPLSEGKGGVVCYEYPYMEKMGFLKVDLLSLHYLTVIKNIEEEIRKDGKDVPDYLKEKDDRATYDTIHSLDLTLVFQLDGTGIKRAIREVDPKNFNDLVALLALYRPGPMDNIPVYAKNKRTGVFTSGYKDIDDILKETYGVIVYQEQIMRLAHDSAGMDMGEADLLRRAISKKHLEEMKDYEGKFLSGAKANGLSATDAQKIYEWILHFANYGFNKSHSVCYALLTFTLAYLKTHFIEEFYKVAMREISPGNEKFKNVVTELNHRDIKLFPVNVNESMAGETFKEGRCYLGLERIKNLSSSMIEKLLEERKKEKFKDLGDFLLRVLSEGHYDRRTFLSLVYSGLFDPFGINRKTLDENANSLLEFMDMGLDASQIPLLTEEVMTLKEKVMAFVKEYELLGISLSINLKDLIGKHYKKGYSVGVAYGDMLLSNQGGVGTLLNAFGKRTFTFPQGVNFKAYDLVLFKAQVDGFGRYWEAMDPFVLSLDELK